MTKKLFTKKYSLHFNLQNFLRRKQVVVNSILLFTLAFYLTSLPITFANQPATKIPNVQFAPNPEKLIEKGEQLYQSGNFSQAVIVLQAAVRTYKLQKDNIYQAAALSNLALVYQQLGLLQEAENAINTSLNLLGWDVKDQKLKVNHQNSEPLEVLAQTFDIQAGLQLSVGQSEVSLTTSQRAEKLWQQLGNGDRVTYSRINQAQALRVSGFYRRALDTLQAVNKQLQTQPDSPMKVAGLRSLGNALQLAGDFEQSQQVLQQSINIAQNLKLPQDISIGEFSLGNTKRAAGDFASAIAHYQKAAEVAPTPFTKIQAQINQLSLLLETEKTADAKVLVPIIRSQLANLPLNHSSLYASIHFARTIKNLGGNQDIAQILAKTVQQAQTLGDRQAESYALGSLGEVYEQTQQWNEAQKLTQKALLIAQEIDASDIAYLWQWQLGRLLRAKGDITAAIAFYDAAVATLQSLRSDLVAVNRDVQFNFRDRVEPIYRQSVELLLQEKGENKPDLDKARKRIETLQLAELDNFFREACLNNQFVVLDRVVDQDNPHTAIFYPIILENQLAVILKLPNKPLIYKNNVVSRQQVEQVVMQLRKDIVQPEKTKKVKELSEQLYNWLIQPIADELKTSGVNTLVFIPDGLLRNIPMAVLYDGKEYLIEKYALALSPGLQLFTPQPLTKTNFNALAGGLSEIPKNEKFAPLPNVKNELNKIQKLGVRTTTLLNDQFISTILEKTINEQPYRIVHLATHGKFSSKATETFILAYDKRIYVGELDTLLKSRSEKRSEPVELLVLSACETASGDNRATLGLAGVAIKAGARSTLASLWNINDDSTAFFISEFYSQLTTGKTTKSEALRQAQIKMLKSDNYSRPAQWAPYVLVGNWL
ncbi:MULTISPECIES: CHAT domain-containing protein [Calothrix]|uniref:CHAT domain-containing protein n=2 Tax=Calothrix TaxID=1186 RepID=A0ABR8A940_9CYAN|nr:MULTISPECIES: CHAT domain-containing protein [Calothrix]MBD2195803.1 CHAT domain-containing protein [Calothrix parietina FACHB-288]MBD2226448.1 CHAT domain-containing protein [Calothrix anomala FACHB-343]